MSEIPERIEREMFEIRSGMASDMTDLRKHIEPQVVAEQVKQTLKQRLQEAFARLKESLQATLKAKQQEILESAQHQISLAREAGESRNTAPLTEAVKSDPRPLAVAAIILALTVFMVRKLGGGRN